jgi:Zn-dependent protease with chaperone function
MTSASGQFFDGESATAHRVEVALEDGGLRISGDSIGKSRFWPLRHLKAASPMGPDRPLRLSNELSPMERLIIENQPMIGMIKESAPQLTRSLGMSAILRFSVLTAVGLVIVAALGYAVLSMVPPLVAQIMPEDWRDRLGKQTEESFVGRYAECKSPAGLRALGVLGNRLYEGNADIAPDFTIGVYNLPVINAFALPGGRIVFSGKLIEAAKAPEDIAGVLAHELGHVNNRDPEAAIIRLTGLQVLISLATGSDGGTVLSNLAGLAAILRYTRSAEINADDYAQMLLNRSKIDPLGLKRFFEAVKKIEDQKAKAGVSIGPLGGLLSTHPATEERIARIKPLQNGPPRPVMSEENWQSLKMICKAN